ncbi:MAG: ABC transporter ATP-binding protein [Gemmatimonadales bacterium]|nr:MAG: ABC transporter ATP-binding protein [Gemmatimonadales bacterium]
MEGGVRRAVLEDLDMEVARGTFVALLGPSGSGKSTLLNLVSGIDAPDRGEIEVAGVPLHALSERERTLFRRDRVGFVFQFFNLIPTLTVLENLLLPMELGRRTTDADRARALALLDRVGLVDRAGAWPDRLSGGEQQRVAVARALAHQPELILADEPTGNLDLETGGRVLSLLEELVRDSGTTLFMVTHSEEAAARADRILEIRGGALTERARP